MSAKEARRLERFFWRLSRLSEDVAMRFFLRRVGPLDLCCCTWQDPEPHQSCPTHREFCGDCGERLDVDAEGACGECGWIPTHYDAAK